MRARVLLNLLSELRKGNTMQGLPSILLPFHSKLYRSANVRFYFSDDPKTTFKWNFGWENAKFLPYLRDIVSLQDPTS